jgi:hypothetical protein
VILVRPTGFVTWAIRSVVALEWMAREFAGANSGSLSPVKRKANADPRGVRIVFTPDRT